MTDEKKKKKTLNCPNKVIDETLQKRKKEKKGEMKLFLKKLRLNAFKKKKNKKVKDFFFFLRKNFTNDCPILRTSINHLKKKKRTSINKLS